MPKLANMKEKIPTIIKDVRLYAPLQFQCSDIFKESYRLQLDFDFLITLLVENKEDSFLAFHGSVTAPKFIKQQLIKAKHYKDNILSSQLLQNKVKRQFRLNELNCMLIVPYITENVLALVKNFGMSVIDLCGNYYIVTKEIISIRLDQKNKYKESSPIKNIFSGNSSLVSRFLLKDAKNYASVNDIHSGILNQGGLIALSTVSKVLSVLDAELLISKKMGQIKVLQANKILNELIINYKEPKLENKKLLKISDKDLEKGVWFNNQFGSDWVFSGNASASHYTLTVSELIKTVYVKQIDNIKDYESERFFNVVLLQTQEPFVYFDKIKKNGFWASEVQACLELSQGDKREKELAETIKQNILGRFV